jgi:hypothetical protein
MTVIGGNRELLEENTAPGPPVALLSDVTQSEIYLGAKSSIRSDAALRRTATSLRQSLGGIRP